MNDAILERQSASLPPDIRSGDPAIDAYLAQINAHLIGTAGVRRATLAEARDFVLDASVGTADRDAGIRAALQEFGSPREIGAAQRRERHAMFLKVALMTGPAFALLMLVASLLGLPSPDDNWRMLAIVFVLNLLAFGSAMGAIFAYVIGGAAATAPGATAVGDGFVVAYRKSSRVLCWILISVFGAMQLLLLLRLFGVDPTGLFQSWPWPLVVFLLVINLKNVVAPLHALAFGAQASPAGLAVHRLSGPLHLQRRQIATIVKPGYVRQLFSTFYGQQCRIGWRDDAGDLHHFTLSLTHDVINGDRLLAWLEAAADDNRALQ